MTELPPVAVMPEWIWQEKCPEPALEQYLRRYLEVSAAVDCYLAAGLEAGIPQIGLHELGVWPPH